jgi:hypothetical protein
VIPFNTELEKEELEKLINGRYSVVLPNIKAPKYLKIKSIFGPFGTKYNIEKRFGFYKGEWWYRVTQWNENKEEFAYYASESDLEEFAAAVKVSTSEDELRAEQKRAQNSSSSITNKDILDELQKLRSFQKMYGELLNSTDNTRKYDIYDEKSTKWKFDSYDSDEQNPF